MAPLPSAAVSATPPASPYARPRPRKNATRCAGPKVARETLATTKMATRPPIQTAIASRSTAVNEVSAGRGSASAMAVPAVTVRVPAWRRW